MGITVKFPFNSFILSTEKQLTKGGVDIHLVQKCEQDEPFLLGLYCAIRAVEVSNWAMTDEQKAAFLQMQYAMQAKQYSSHFSESDYYIVWQDSQRIGRFIVDRSSEVWRIVDISLLPLYQNQGIGSMLIRELQADAVQLGKSIRLSVLQTNSAARLYARLGFVKQDEDEVYMTMLYKEA